MNNTISTCKTKGTIVLHVQEISNRIVKDQTLAYLWLYYKEVRDSRSRSYHPSQTNYNTPDVEIQLKFLFKFFL